MISKGKRPPRKHCKNKVWVAQWWEDGRKKSKVLGRRTTMGKSGAEAATAVILNVTQAQRISMSIGIALSCDGRGQALGAVVMRAGVQGVIEREVRPLERI
jgi:hypothetical protein